MASTSMQNKTNLFRRCIKIARCCICSLATVVFILGLLSSGKGNNIIPHASAWARGLPSMAQAVASSYVVAQNGSGNFKTVQEAVNAVPANNKNHVVIYIKDGTYKEIVTVPFNKPFITFYGQDKKNTIITDDNHAGKTKPGGGTYQTSDSASVYLYGNDFTAINITFQNSSGPVGQAIAAYVTSDRASFYDCQFLGWQDTLYSDRGHQYYRNVYIQGSIDYIFGDATAVFENSELHNIAGGSIAAQSRTNANRMSGYVFINDKLTGGPANSTILGRPWRPYSRVVYLTCFMANDITPAGWHYWDNIPSPQMAYFAEYNSTGPGAHASARVSWSHQLTAQQAQQFSVKNFLNQDGWLTTANQYHSSLLKTGFPR